MRTFRKCGNLRTQIFCRCVILSVLWWKFSDLQFADYSPKKFAGLQFAVQSKEICGFEIFGLKYLRKLRIFDCELSPRICGFEVSTTPVVNLPPVSTAPVVHLELWIFPQNFEKQTYWDTHGLRGNWFMIPFKLPFACTKLNSKIESCRFSMLFLSNWKIYSMPVNLLKGPSPALTHTERKANLRQWRQ